MRVLFFVQSPAETTMSSSSLTTVTQTMATAASSPAVTATSKERGSGESGMPPTKVASKPSSMSSLIASGTSNAHLMTPPPRKNFNGRGLADFRTATSAANQNNSIIDHAFHCSASSVESLPSASGSSK